MLTTRDGRLVQWWHGGATDGPLVVVFHGCPDTRHVAMTGERIAAEHGVQLLCVNRPGYGMSSPHASTQASVADDAAAVALELGHEWFAVLGMSVGGMYAIACAARHRDRVSALGLAAPQRPDAEPGTVAEKVERFRPGFLDYLAALDPTEPDDNALAGRFLAQLPDADAALLRPSGASAVAASVREALATPEGYLRDAALLLSPWEQGPQHVRCPAHVWVGEFDDRASTMPGLLDATIVVRPGTTHLATLLPHWDDVLRTLLPTLTD